MMQLITYLSRNPFFMQSPLDRDVWLDDKEGMEFLEEAPDFSNMEMVSTAAEGMRWIVLLRIIAVAVLAGLIIFLIVRLLTRRSRETNGKHSGVNVKEIAEEGPTALSPMEELWAAYKSAKEEKNFREAVRILYQIVIKHLDNQGKLKAAPDKTNREYTGEMSWEEKAPDFFKLTVLHEFIWYGAADVKQGDFDQAEPRFLQFIESIKNG